jgi:O-antigen ligase
MNFSKAEKDINIKSGYQDSDSIYISPKLFITLLILFSPFSIGILVGIYYPFAWLIIVFLFYINIDNFFTHNRILKSNFLIPIIILIASFYLSMIFGMNYKNMLDFTKFDSSFEGVFVDVTRMIITQILIIYLIYLSIDSIDDINYYLNVFIVSSIIVNISIFYYYINDIFVVDRLGGTFQDTNYMGRFQVITISVVLCKIIFKKIEIWKRLIGILYILLCTYFLMLASARAAILTLGLVVIVIMLFTKSRKILLLTSVVLVFGIIYLLRYAASVKAGASLTSGGLFASFMDLSNSTRIALNVAAFNMFTDYPIFGIGFKNFYNAYINYEYIPSDIPVGMLVSVVHSWFFSVLGEQGLVGIISLLWIIYLVFKNLLQKIKNSVSDYKVAGITLLSFFVILLFMGFFNPNFFSEYFFAIISGLAGGYFKIIEHNN